MFEVSPGDTIVDQFPVFEDDGFTKHTGLVQADFGITVWQDGVVNVLPVVLTEIGSSGEYKLVYTPPVQGWWKVELFSAFTGEYYISTAAVGVSADLTGVKGDLARILGLLHQNAMLDQQTYNLAGDLLTARLRVFNNPGNVPLVPGGSETLGLIQEYAIAASYPGTGPGTGKPDMFKLRRIL